MATIDDMLDYWYRDQPSEYEKDFAVPNENLVKAALGTAMPVSSLPEEDAPIEVWKEVAKRLFQAKEEIEDRHSIIESAKQENKREIQNIKKEKNEEIRKLKVQNDRLQDDCDLYKKLLDHIVCRPNFD